jgi:hypothetical protein
MLYCQTVLISGGLLRYECICLYLFGIAILSHGYDKGKMCMSLFIICMYVCMYAGMCVCMNVWM